MFGDDELNGRHVDYGSSTKKSRKQLLQETRALRARRKKQKKEHEAATKIQVEWSLVCDPQMPSVVLLPEFCEGPPV